MSASVKSVHECGIENEDRGSVGSMFTKKSFLFWIERKNNSENQNKVTNCLTEEETNWRVVGKEFSKKKKGLFCKDQ